MKRKGFTAILIFILTATLFSAKVFAAEIVAIPGVVGLAGADMDLTELQELEELIWDLAGSENSLFYSTGIDAETHMLIVWLADYTPESIEYFRQTIVDSPLISFEQGHDGNFDDWEDRNPLARIDINPISAEIEPVIGIVPIYEEIEPIYGEIEPINAELDEDEGISIILILAIAGGAIIIFAIAVVIVMKKRK